MDLDVLCVLKKRSNYEKYSKYIKDYSLPKEGMTILKSIEEYYNKHTTEDDIVWNSFHTWFMMYPGRKYNKETREVYSNLFNKLSSHVIDKSLEENIMLDVISQDYATKIHSVALDIITGDEDKDIEEIENLVSKYKEEIDKYTSKKKEYLDMEDYLAVHSVLAGGTGLEWRIENLNECVGSLRKGNFVIVGARPDSGKTTFLVSECVNWARQLPEDGSILWFNNEELDAKVAKRLYQSASGFNDEQYKLDPKGAMEKYKAYCGGANKIKQIKQSMFTSKEIESAIKKYKPSLIIFDQLWKVVGFEREASNEVGRQALLFAWARGLGQEYGPVITVHQLGGDAEGERWPTMRALYGSQTAIQGEADLIITIGKSRDPAERKWRFFNLVKNKLGDGPRVKSGFRNGMFALELDEEHSRFKEVGEYVIS